MLKPPLAQPRSTGAKAKAMAPVAGMLAEADSIDDMNLLRHGGMDRLFDRTCAPATSGSFLREFRSGHVRHLDAVASRTLVNLAGDAPLCRSGKGAARIVGDVLATLRRMNPRAAFGAC